MCKNYQQKQPTASAFVFMFGDPMQTIQSESDNSGSSRVQSQTPQSMIVTHAHHWTDEDAPPTTRHSLSVGRPKLSRRRRARVEDYDRTVADTLRRYGAAPASTLRHAPQPEASTQLGGARRCCFCKEQPKIKTSLLRCCCCSRATQN